MVCFSVMEDEIVVHTTRHEFSPSEEGEKYESYVIYRKKKRKKKLLQDERKPPNAAEVPRPRSISMLDMPGILPVSLNAIVRYLSRNANNKPVLIKPSWDRL